MSKLSLQVAFDTIINYNSYTNEQKIQVLQECVDIGIDINQNNSEILICAIDDNNYSIVKFLIENGINIGMDNSKPLEKACRLGNIKIIKLLLDAGSNKTNIFESTIYDVEVVKLLIEYGYNPFDDNNTLLCNSCKNNSIDIVKYLISIGADCTKPNNQPIENVFRKYRKYEIKELLLRNGADPNHIKNTNNGKVSLLEYSVRHSNLKNCELLFAYGANVESCTNIINCDYDKFYSGHFYHHDMIKIIELFMVHGLDITDFVNKIHVTSY